VEGLLLSPLSADERSNVATLKEAVMAAKEGCRLSTLRAHRRLLGLDWVGFVDQLPA